MKTRPVSLMVRWLLVTCLAIQSVRGDEILEDKKVVICAAAGSSRDARQRSLANEPQHEGPAYDDPGSHAGQGDRPRADEPVPRTDENSKRAHQDLLNKARLGATTARIDVYFIGDSITRRWGCSDPQ